VAVADMHAHLSAKTPDTATLAEIDTSLATWVENRILAHEQMKEGAYLDSARAHMAFAQNVSTSSIDGLLPETQTAVDTASFWFENLSEELLAENVAEAKDLIEPSGSSYQEIDLILETGLVLHEEFLRYGFDAEANELLELAKSRIEHAMGRCSMSGLNFHDPLSLEDRAFVISDERVLIDMLHHMRRDETPAARDVVEMLTLGCMGPDIIRTGLSFANRFSCGVSRPSYHSEKPQLHVVQ
jgi:hypothetical protein